MDHLHATHFAGWFRYNLPAEGVTFSRPEPWQCPGRYSKIDKTATARQRAASEVLLDVDPRARQAIAVDPSLVPDGGAPRVIDEWQVEPAIWNHVRRTVDDRGAPGQFILTNWAVPADDVTSDPGTEFRAGLRIVLKGLKA